MIGSLPVPIKRLLSTVHELHTSCAPITAACAAGALQKRRVPVVTMKTRDPERGVVRRGGLRKRKGSLKRTKMASTCLGLQQLHTHSLHVLLFACACMHNSMFNCMHNSSVHTGVP